VVLAADVTLSDWHCSLEGEGKTTPRLRLGLLMIKGLNEATGQAIVTARAQQPFRDIADLSQRATLDKRALNALAAADANISGHRRAALWQTLGMESPMPLLPNLNATPLGDIQPSLFPPSEGENIVADYAHLGLSLRRHPLALLRPRLRQMRLASSAEIKTARHGQLMRAVGLVTCRQRPSTSSGVTFVTLEDEDGYINVVIWRDLAERQRGVLLGARLLAVYGSVERQGGVIHLIAGRLVDHSRLLGDLQIHSHDFH
jgi:error-prone DNA polymerase